LLVLVRRRAALVVASLLLPLLPVLGSAASADAPGTLVLPPRYGELPVQLGGFSGSPAGFVYRRVEGGDTSLPLRAKASGSSGHSTVPTAFHASDGSSGGVVTGSVITGLVDHPGQSGPFHVGLVDLATQAVTVSARTYPYPSASNQDAYLGGTGNGWLGLSARGAFQEVVRSVVTSGGSTVDTDLLRLPNDTNTLYYHVPTVAADENGALIAVTREDSSNFDNYGVALYWVANGQAPVQVADFQNTYYELALSPGSFAWVAGGRPVIHRRLRSTPAVEDSTRTVGVGAPANRYHLVEQVAITDATTAWLESQFINGAGDQTVQAWTAPAAAGSTGTPVTGALDPSSLGLSAADGGDFAVVAGGTGASRGIYRLHPAATAYTTPALDLAGPAAPLSIDASAGRLAYTVAAASGGQHLNDQGLTRSVSAVTARGGTRDLGTGIGINATTAARTASLEYVGDTLYAVVRDGVVVTARIRALPDTYAVAVSGQRLLTTNFGEEPGNPNFVNGFGNLYDLGDPGAAPRRVPESSALSGSKLAFLTTSGNSSDGSIQVIDLDSPATPPVVVRPAGVPATVDRTTLNPRLATVLMSGDWVGWSFQGVSSDGSFPKPGEISFARVSDPSVRDDLTGKNPGELRLADGLAAYLDEDRSVHLVDLAPKTDTAVGAARAFAGNRIYLALDDDFLAYVAADDTTHVLPVAAQTPAAPTALGGTTPKSTSPGVRPWQFADDVSRPLSSYRLVVKSSSGGTVLTRTGAAPDGGVRQTWNGRDSANRLLPDGTYTWTLTGTGSSGALGAASAKAPLSATVVVDSKAPRSVVAHAPGRANDASTTPAFLVTWAGSEAGLRYDVDVEYRQRTSSTTFSWSAPRHWLTGTSATRATYRGAPIVSSPGQVLRFLVTGRDAAGNPRAAVPVLTLVPLDDRSTAFAYSAGWRRGGSASDYAKTLASTGTAGRSVTVTALAQRIDVLGLRNASSGQVRVYADGRYQRTVDLRSASEQRRCVLLSVSFAKTGVHSVKLVVVGTKGRPTVAVDGATLYR
jgi:hypothetical protein